MRRYLLLFDIDGTLLHLHGAREHARALLQALSEAHGVELATDAVWKVGPWGKTDRLIAREVLAAAGVPDARIDAAGTAWMDRVAELYAGADLADLPAAVAPGAREGLDWSASEGHTIGLLTGNIEAVARLKLRAAGLGEWFDDAPGGFGSDAEARAELVPLARRRAGGQARERTVVIGDAPGDIACALAGGVHSVGVTGRFGPDELTGATALITRLDELPGAVGAL